MRHKSKLEKALDALPIELQNELKGMRIWQTLSEPDKFQLIAYMQTRARIRSGKGLQVENEE